MTKLISKQSEWDRVAQELEKENFKLMSYDKTMLELFGGVAEKKVLDYGSGPGILAKALKELGADINTFDILDEMNRLSAEKIGQDNVYRRLVDIPSNHFDIIICNLVLCIIEEGEVDRALLNIKKLLAADGRAYIGFCNPRIFDVPESQIDIRHQTGSKYEENHSYKKVKKEGGYEIIETHRPIEWYERAYEKAGLKLIETHFTPEYEFKNKKIKDYVIFELGK